MSLVVNNNMMAANTARNLNAHYGRLATSTQRLSSGLRVNSAADDAAGLAIRELQRADIAALHQGARNANDAISMIQVADGSLGIIDEKLIRMKELAEQAATGTYDSTQRLMIESEYQAMASEITRIANATDFNGTKLLDGTLSGDHDGSKLVSEGKIKIHFGTGNDSAEDYYYIEIGECTSEAFGLGNNSTWKDVQDRGTDAFRDSLYKQIKNSDLTDKEKAKAYEGIDEAVKNLDAALTNATDYKQAFKYWAAEDSEGFMPDGKVFEGNSSLMADYLAAAASADNINTGPTDAKEIVTKIQDAIKDAAPSSSEIDAMWPADGDEATIAKVQLDLLNKINAAAKQAATDAGLTDTEIQDLLAGIEESWYGDPFDQATKPGTMPTPKTTKTGAAAPWDTDANSGLTKLLKDIEDTINPAPTVPATFVITSTIAEKAAYRNQAKVEYANGTITEVGPTTAEGVVASLLALSDKVWATATEKAFPGGEAADQATQKAAFDAAVEEMVEGAKKLGLRGDDPNANPKGDLQLIREKAASLWTDQSTNLADPAKDSFTLTQWNQMKSGTVTPTGGGNPQGGFDFAIQWFNKPKDAAGTPEVPGQDLEGLTRAEEIALRNQGAADAKAADKLDEFWNNLRETEKQKLKYAWGQAAIYNLSHADEGRFVPDYGINADTFNFKTVLGVNEFGDTNLIDNEMLKQGLTDVYKKVGHMDFAGHTIETQEDAQQALDAINEAIVSKDKIRAHLGAAQNRLENTVSNLNIQAENLQAAESRISDVDVATEMTQFVRNQILTQSAVAMLSQANSLPQMAMQLIGG